MNFCKESDRYISLYVDDLLEPKEKEEFLKHIEQCSACKQKLDEMSLIVGLCREDDDIQLPNDFSSSMHKRLVELNVQEKDSKGKLFIYNKKWIASLSTAAILAVSLFAYSLLPNIDLSKSTSSMDKSVAESAVTLENGNNSVEEAPSDTTAQDSGTAVASGRAGTDLQTTYGKKAAQDQSEDQIASARKSAEAEALPKMAESFDGNTAFTMMAAEQYFENSVEIKMDISTRRIEIDALKKLMKDLVATQSYISLNEKNEVQYFDYFMPLGRYYELMSGAGDIYHLKLSQTTDIVKNDVTPLYDELNIQKNDLEQKINAAKEKGEDTSALEAERDALLQKINDIIVKNDMISVRILIYR